MTDHAIFWLIIGWCAGVYHAYIYQRVTEG